ncbi:MAG: hypothetical protein R2867_46650 [Caldilineaceae bacterium]
MTETMPYRVVVDDDEIVIHADRTLFDTVSLTKLLDYLRQETHQRQTNEQDSIDSQQFQLQQEVEAYKMLHPQFLAQHRGEWVAILHGQLIDHDPNEAVLMARLTEQHPNTLPLVRLVEDEVDRELSMPSFRLVA